MSGRVQLHDLSPKNQSFCPKTFGGTSITLSIWLRLPPFNMQNFKKIQFVIPHLDVRGLKAYCDFRKDLTPLTVGTSCCRAQSTSLGTSHWCKLYFYFFFCLVSWLVTNGSKNEGKSRLYLVLCLRDVTPNLTTIHMLVLHIFHHLRFAKMKKKKKPREIGA